MTHPVITAVKTIRLVTFGAPPEARGRRTNPMGVLPSMHGAYEAFRAGDVRYLIVEIETDTGLIGYGNVGVNPAR